MAQRARIGVRELRQNLSVYLRRVKAGESLEVTERGQPVAQLVPLEDRRGSRERLVAQGKLVPAAANLVALGAPPAGRTATPLSDALQDVREDRL
jgi:prevent-host-death family protein